MLTTDEQDRAQEAICAMHGGQLTVVGEPRWRELVALRDGAARRPVAWPQFTAEVIVYGPRAQLGEDGHVGGDDTVEARYLVRPDGTWVRRWPAEGMWHDDGLAPDSEALDRAGLDRIAIRLTDGTELPGTATTSVTDDGTGSA